MCNKILVFRDFQIISKEQITPVQNIDDPIIKLILNHQRLLAIGEVCRESSSPFSFYEVDKAEILKEIIRLKTPSICQHTDVPARVIKEYADIFADFLHSSLNISVKKSTFELVFKQANIRPIFNIAEKESKTIIDY